MTETPALIRTSFIILSLLRPKLILPRRAAATLAPFLSERGAGLETVSPRGKEAVPEESARAWTGVKLGPASRWV
jgi:hypothetical protein